MPLGLYEQETATWLANNVGRGQTALDVGANAGYFTLLLAHVVGACGQVVAFEPVPLNVRVIEEQIRLNKLARTHLEAIALTDTTGELSFVVERTNANSHLEQVEIQHAVSRPEKVVKVQAERLDDWVARTDMTPDLIKVDVEGGEARLLEGAKQLLARQQTRWLVSTHSAELRTAVFGTFVSAGYDVSSLRGFEHEVVAIPTRP